MSLIRQITYNKKHWLVFEEANDPKIARKQQFHYGYHALQVYQIIRAARSYNQLRNNLLKYVWQQPTSIDTALAKHCVFTQHANYWPWQQHQFVIDH